MHFNNGVINFFWLCKYSTINYETKTLMLQLEWLPLSFSNDSQDLCHTRIISSDEMKSFKIIYLTFVYLNS